MSDCNSLIGYDQAYLEVAQCLYNLDNDNVKGFINLLEALDSNDRNGYRNLSQEEDYVFNCLKEIRRGVEIWRSNYNTNVDHGNVNDQMLLARVAAGINWANKKINIDKRLIAFLYAAYSAQKFLQDCELWDEYVKYSIGSHLITKETVMHVTAKSSLLNCFFELVQASHTASLPVMTISTREEYSKFAESLLETTNLTHVIWIMNGSPTKVSQNELNLSLLSSWDVKYQNCKCKSWKRRVIVFYDTNEICNYLDDSNKKRREAFEKSCNQEKSTLFFTLSRLLPQELSYGKSLDLGYVESANGEGKMIFHSPFGTSTPSTRYSPVTIYPRSLYLGSSQSWDKNWHDDFHPMLKEIASRVELVNALRDDTPDNLQWIFNNASALLESLRSQSENE